MDELFERAERLIAESRRIRETTRSLTAKSQEVGEKTKHLIVEALIVARRVEPVQQVRVNTIAPPRVVPPPVVAFSRGSRPGR
jgi:hypothetical protein